MPSAAAAAPTPAKFFFGGFDAGATVFAGGLQIIENGQGLGPDGSASGGDLERRRAGRWRPRRRARPWDSGGLQVVDSGGVATGTTVNAGGAMELVSGASYSSLTISSGGAPGDRVRVHAERLRGSAAA